MASNLRVDTILPSTGLTLGIGTASGTINFLGNSNIVTTGNVSIGGTLTYEDVTNVDSVGVITARSGINISSGSLTIPDSIIHSGDSNTKIRFPAADTVSFETAGSERLRVGSSGQLGIGGANYGSSGQVLTSQGNSSAPTWATPSSGLAMADMWRLNTTYSIPTNSTSILSTANWERPDQTDGFAQLGTGMSVNSSDHAAGVWTFPSTGFYLVTYNGIVYNGSNDPYEVLIRMEFCEDGSTFNIQSRVYGGGEQGNYNPITGQGLVDVTNTSNVKMRLRVYSANASSTLQGNSNENRNYFTVIRLGDT